MPLVATRGGASAFGLGWSAGSSVEVFPMALMMPSSINYTGTSASIGTNGTVDFSACTSLSLNGVFNKYYDQYILVMSIRTATDYDSMYLKMRAGGVTSTQNSNYTTQEFQANGGTLGSGSGSAATFGFPDDANKSAIFCHISNPYGAEYTVYNSQNSSAALDSFLRDYAVVHKVASSYDGFELTTGSYSFTGTLSVYGLGG